MVDSTQDTTSATSGPASEAKAAPSGKSKQRKKYKKHVVEGRAYIKATFNNTKITITDGSGNALCSASAGGKGFRGARKSTAFAAQVAAEDVGKRAVEEFGMVKMEVFTCGPGSGRESAIIGLVSAGLKPAGTMKDISPRTHNGCRQPKKRRV